MKEGKMVKRQEGEIKRLKTEQRETRRLTLLVVNTDRGNMHREANHFFLVEAGASIDGNVVNEKMRSADDGMSFVELLDSVLYKDQPLQEKELRKLFPVEARIRRPWQTPPRLESGWRNFANYLNLDVLYFETTRQELQNNEPAREVFYLEAEAMTDEEREALVEKADKELGAGDASFEDRQS